MSQHTRPKGVLLRLNFAARRGLGSAVHGEPDGRALEELLGGLGQLRSSAALDRAILDHVHQDAARNTRSQPVLLLVVTMSCVVFGAVVKFPPAETAPGANLASHTTGEKLVLSPPGHALPEPVPLALKNAAPAPAKLPLLAMVSPLDTYHPKAKSALASRASVGFLPRRATAAVSGEPAIRLAAVTPRPVTPLPIMPSAPAVVRADVEVLPISKGVSAGGPSVALPSALAWSGTELAAAPIKLHERLNGMVSPTGLLAGLPQQRDGDHRPLYKRPWFVGMLGVAATGIAVGVTAAVVSSQQASHGALGQPIRFSLGPT